MEKLAEILVTEAGAVAGILLVVIVGLLYAVRTLWNDNKAMRTDLQSMQQRYEDRNIEVIEEATRTMERMRSTVREQTATIELLARGNHG